MEQSFTTMFYSCEAAKNNAHIFNTSTPQLAGLEINEKGGRGPKGAYVPPHRRDGSSEGRKSKNSDSNNGNSRQDNESGDRPRQGDRQADRGDRRQGGGDRGGDRYQNGGGRDSE